LYKQRHPAGDHAPKGRADTGYCNARERDKESDECRLAVRLVQHSSSQVAGKKAVFGYFQAWF